MITDRPLTLTVDQTARLLGISRSTAYELVQTGELECLRLRRRVVVPTARVAEWLGVTVSDVWAALPRNAPSA
jgi:excisionase family DNA binding protein